MSLRRRDVMTLLGGVAASPILRPLVAHAQQAKLPVIGWLSPGDPVPTPPRLAFIAGLSEMGFVDGRNVTIDYSGLRASLDRLPEVAADMVRRRVAVIVTPGYLPAARAAKAATSTIPIVFGGGSDPVETGLVTSLNRPGGNMTGFVEVNTELAAKRLGLLHDLAPRVTRLALLVDSDVPTAALSSAVAALQAGAPPLGVQVETIKAPGTRDGIDAAFASLPQRGIEGLLLSPSPLYYRYRMQIAALAARHALPAIYWDRAFVESGGLMSYGSSVINMFRQVGIYAGRILKGEKPADMPVQQATKFELVLNLTAAKILGIAVLPTLLAIADEVVE